MTTPHPFVATSDIPDSTDARASRQHPRTAYRVVTLSVVTALGAGFAPAATAGSASAGPAVATVTVGHAGAASVPARPDHHGRPAIAARYTWRRVAPALLPDGSLNTLRSTAVGIDGTGRVAGYAIDGSDHANDSFVGDGRRSTWLASAAAHFAGSTHATAVSPHGVVVGRSAGIEGRFPIWGAQGRLRIVTTPDSYYGPAPAAMNGSGVLAGVLDGVKVSDLFYGRPDRLVTVPDARGGNYRVTGIAESGLAVGSRHHPHYRNDGHYPEGIVFTARGVTDIKTAQTSAVDAISPNGRLLVGRVGPDLWESDRGRMAWLSTAEEPVLLKGADSLKARSVTDAGVVAGSKDGRAVLWQNGRVVDLNDRVRRLPSGWVLTDVVAVNKAGELAVNAIDPGGRSVALQVSPKGR